MVEIQEKLDNILQKYGIKTPCENIGWKIDGVFREGVCALTFEGFNYFVLTRLAGIESEEKMRIANLDLFLQSAGANNVRGEYPEWVFNWLNFECEFETYELACKKIKKLKKKIISEITEKEEEYENLFTAKEFDFFRVKKTFLPEEANKFVVEKVERMITDLKNNELFSNCLKQMSNEILKILKDEYHSRTNN